MSAALVEREVSLDIGGLELVGTLSESAACQGLVVFVHGSGSSRFSPRNRFVAQILQQGQMATLLLDLLTPAEEAIDQETGALRFDIPLLTKRVIGVLGWAAGRNTAEVPAGGIGLFGSSTGAAAALLAAAGRPWAVQAVVSRGGRPDLAADGLGRVQAPTLLIVGAQDPVVLDLNREAYAALAGPRQLEVVPGATHLFEEPGTLERVAELARSWFQQHLGGRQPR